MNNKLSDNLRVNKAATELLCNENKRLQTLENRNAKLQKSLYL
jgi:hypothetical protein